MIKKILKIVFYLLVIVAIFIVLGFAVENNNKNVCENFEIHVEYSSDNFFVDENDIREEVYSILGNIEGNILADININRINNIVNEMVFIENAHVYRTVDGQIKIIASPRRPVARIINEFNQSYYIDDNGLLMPVSRKYSARVPVVFGSIEAAYSTTINLNREETEDLSNNEKDLYDIFKLISFIKADLFWNAFIDQVYLTADDEFELIPNGNIHTIEFGTIDNMKYKFDKMKIFYKNGLTRVGWNKYNRINVKYSNQIVCSK